MTIRGCSDILNDERRISAYIDEMAKISDGSTKVHNWDNDLKKLKHYRWIRNQIVHEPDCQEENICHPDDVAWLNNFYSRIMNQTDPLDAPRPRHFRWFAYNGQVTRH